MNAKARSSLFGIAALYLLYIAYQLFQGRSDPESSMSPVVLWICIVFFVLAAMGVLYYAYIIRKNGDKQE